MKTSKHSTGAMRALITALALAAAVNVATFATSCSTFGNGKIDAPLGFGVEYSIADTGAKIIIEPDDQGSLAWRFEVPEGTVNQWVEKTATGWILTSPKTGNRYSIERGAGGKPIVRILATGDAVPFKIRAIPIEPKQDAKTPIPVA